MAISWHQFLSRRGTSESVWLSAHSIKSEVELLSQIISLGVDTPRPADLNRLFPVPIITPVIVTVIPEEPLIVHDARVESPVIVEVSTFDLKPKRKKTHNVS